jgi:hypothetical protein
MHGTLESSSIWQFDCSFHVWRGLPMQKLVLAICLLSVVVPFAAAQNGGNGNGNQNGQFPKHKGHAAEMSGIAMAVAGVIGLGGYLVIRRRHSLQN